jgi:hypothetical protein
MIVVTSGAPGAEPGAKASLGGGLIRLLIRRLVIADRGGTERGGANRGSANRGSVN